MLSSDNLRWAWQRVKANKGAPGIDGVTIAEFPAYARTYWPAIKEQLKDGRYQPQPMRRVEIPKPGGGNAHQAIRKVQAEVMGGRRIAVDIDLAKFFDTVNHDMLMGLLARSIGDKAYLRGWTAYYGISQYYRPIPELKEWIRRRIRMCYWKQWRWPRTKIKNLVALGVDLVTAIKHGVSSHGYWHMAEPQACNKPSTTRG